MGYSLGDDSTEVTTMFLLMEKAKLVIDQQVQQDLHIYCQNPMIPMIPACHIKPYNLNYEALCISISKLS
jgi:hypothetical protein